MDSIGKFPLGTRDGERSNAVLAAVGYNLYGALRPPAALAGEALRALIRAFFPEPLLAPVG